MQAGGYVWRSYKEVYDVVVKLGKSLRSVDIGQVSHIVLGLY